MVTDFMTNMIMSAAGRWLGSLAATFSTGSGLLAIAAMLAAVYLIRKAAKKLAGVGWLLALGVLLAAFFLLRGGAGGTSRRLNVVLPPGLTEAKAEGKAEEARANETRRQREAATTLDGAAVALSPGGMAPLAGMAGPFPPPMPVPTVPHVQPPIVLHPGQAGGLSARPGHAAPSHASASAPAPAPAPGHAAPAAAGGAGAGGGGHTPGHATAGAAGGKSQDGNHNPATTSATPGTPAGKPSVPAGKAGGGGTGGLNEAARTLELRRRRKAAANGGDPAARDNGQGNPMTGGSRRGGVHPGSGTTHPDNRTDHHPDAGTMPGHHQPQGMQPGHGNGEPMGGLFHPTEGGRLGMPFHPGGAGPMNGLPTHGQQPGGMPPGQFGGGFDPMGGMGQTAGHPAHMDGFGQMGIPNGGGFGTGHGGGHR